MLYQCELTIPANTPETSPASAILKLARGVSTVREVEFPDGCSGLAHAKLDHGGWQVLPWTRGEWATSSGGVVKDASPYPIQEPPFEFVVFGYNEDEVHEHTLQIRVIMREGETEEFLNLAQFLDALRGH